MFKKIRILTVLLLIGSLFSNSLFAASKKTYVIGTDVTYAPFEFKDKNGKDIGIDMDLIREVAKRNNFNVEIKPMGFNAAVQALENNQVDGVIAGMSITKERQQKFNMSDSYYNSAIAIAAAKDNQTIKSYDDLKNQKVAIKLGTKAGMYAKELQKKYNLKISEFDDSNSMYNDVTSGNSVVAFEDEPVIKYGIKNGLALKVVPPVKEAGGYGFATRKEDKYLINTFNKELKKMKKDGTYNKIINKYVGSGSKVETEDRSFLGLIKSNYSVILSGLKETIILTFVAILFALLIGIIFGLMKISQNIVLRGIASFYIDFMRGIPVMVIALYFYMGLPGLTGHRVSDWTAGVLTLSLNAGAYIAELVRGGVEAVPKGQMEAAKSLGLPRYKIMFRIILPQAIRIMIPSFINQFVITLKDTSLLSVIGLTELTQTGKIIIARNMEGNKIWAIIALTYFVIIFILTKIAKILEKRYTNG